MRNSLHNLGIKFLQRRERYSLEKGNYERKNCVWFGLMHSNSVENLIAIKPKNQKRKTLKTKCNRPIEFYFSKLKKCQKIKRDRGKSL